MNNISIKYSNIENFQSLKIFNIHLIIFYFIIYERNVLNKFISQWKMEKKLLLFDFLLHYI